MPLVIAINVVVFPLTRIGAHIGVHEAIHAGKPPSHNPSHRVLTHALAFMPLVSVVDNVIFGLMQMGVWVCGLEASKP